MYKLSKSNKVKISRKEEELFVKNCNKILVSLEKKCQCYNRENFPSNNIKQCIKYRKTKVCQDYNLCKKYFYSKMNGYEPKYNPSPWENPVILNSHNCYTYFLNDHNEMTISRCNKICKKNNTCKSQPKKCSELKPQPGYFSHYLKSKKAQVNSFNCKNMIHNIISDNPSIKQTTFYDKCPNGYYKGALVTETDETYHFYRQDNNVLWSHKPGILKVTNVDASNKIIYAPHLADRDYKKGQKVGINYNEFCSYFCVPSNYFKKTFSI